MKAIISVVMPEKITNEVEDLFAQGRRSYNAFLVSV